MAKAKIVGEKLIASDLAVRNFLDANAKDRAAALAQGTKVPKVARLPDGNGLTLVDILGNKPVWRFEYRMPCADTGRMLDKGLSLGTYPAVLLAVARVKVQPLRDAVALGNDPSDERKAKREAAKAADAHARTNQQRIADGLAPLAPAGSLEDVAVSLHKKETDAGNWGVQHGEYVLDVVRRNYEAIKHKHMAAITEEDLKACIDPYVTVGKLITAKDMLDFAKKIFVHARLQKVCKHNIAADLDGYVKRPASKNHPQLKDQSRLGELVCAARDSTRTIAAAALQMQIMLFQRPANTCGMRWADIDFAARVWRIPAEQMKLKPAQRARFDFHIVPLPKQALRLLLTLREITGHLEHVFVARTDGRDEPIATATLLYALRDCGFTEEEINSHGTRGTASTAIRDHIPGQWDDEIEANLAHVYGGAQGATYNKAAYVEKRRPMLQAYADHLDAVAAGTWQAEQQEKAEQSLRDLQAEFGIAANVVPMRKAA